MKINHNNFLKLAFNIAKVNLGKTGLNPSVGCVIVKDEKIISIVQEVSDKYSFFEGQKVKVVKSNYRSRVQPFNN